MPGDGARVLPLELVPVPRHGAQISTRAPTKGYVQTGASARAKSEQGLCRERNSKAAKMKRIFTCKPEARMCLLPPHAFLGDNERRRIGEHGNELEARAEADGKGKLGDI